MKRAGVLFGIALALACGGGGSSPLANKTLNITPDNVAIAPLGTQQYTSDANEAVTWSASRGSIDANGLFTAPDTLGDVTISAALVSDPATKDTIGARIWFTRDVVVTFKNNSQNPARMTDGVANYDLPPGGEDAFHASHDWTDETTPAHFTVKAQITGQPEVSQSIDILASEARDPSFHGLTATFDGTAITIVKN